MLASLEAGYVVLRHTVGIVRVLGLTACIVGACGSEAVGIEPVRDKRRPWAKDRLATLIRLPLCSGSAAKALVNEETATPATKMTRIALITMKRFIT